MHDEKCVDYRNKIAKRLLESQMTDILNKPSI